MKIIKLKPLVIFLIICSNYGNYAVIGCKNNNMLVNDFSFATIYKRNYEGNWVFNTFLRPSLQKTPNEFC